MASQNSPRASVLNFRRFALSKWSEYVHNRSHVDERRYQSLVRTRIATIDVLSFTGPVYYNLIDARINKFTAVSILRWQIFHELVFFY